MKVSDSKNRLQELLEAFNITQADVARRTGLPKSTVSLYFSGNRIPRQDKIGLICDAYNVDPAWLMGYDVPMKRRSASTTAEEHFDLLSKFSRLSRKDQELVMSMIDSMLEKKS